MQSSGASISRYHQLIFTRISGGLTATAFTQWDMNWKWETLIHGAENSPPCTAVQFWNTQLGLWEIFFNCFVFFPPWKIKIKWDRQSLLMEMLNGRKVSFSELKLLPMVSSCWRKASVNWTDLQHWLGVGKFLSLVDLHVGLKEQHYR